MCRIYTAFNILVFNDFGATSPSDRNSSLHNCVRSSLWMVVWDCPSPGTVWALSRNPDSPTGLHRPVAHQSRQVDPRLSTNLSRSWRSRLPRAKCSPAAALRPLPTTGSVGRRETKSKVARAEALRHLPHLSLCLTLPLPTPLSLR